MIQPGRLAAIITSEMRILMAISLGQCDATAIRSAGTGNLERSHTQKAHGGVSTSLLRLRSFPIDQFQRKWTQIFPRCPLDNIFHRSSGRSFAVCPRRYRPAVADSTYDLPCICLLYTSDAADERSS